MLSQREILLLALLTAALNPVSFLPAAGYVVLLALYVGLNTVSDMPRIMLAPFRYICSCANFVPPPRDYEHKRTSCQRGHMLCRGLLLMWLLQRPVSPLCDEYGAKPWVKRIVGSLFMRLQQSIGRPFDQVEGAGVGEAAEDGGDAEQQLLWHLAFGSNMNPEVRAGPLSPDPLVGHCRAVCGCDSP